MGSKNHETISVTINKNIIDRTYELVYMGWVLDVYGYDENHDIIFSHTETFDIAQQFELLNAVKYWNNACTGNFEEYVCKVTYEPK